MGNGNPIVQLVIKEVNNDLEAKRLTTMQKVRDFKKKIAEFEKAGVSLYDVIDKMVILYMIIIRNLLILYLI